MKKTTILFLVLLPLYYLKAQISCPASADVKITSSSASAVTLAANQSLSISNGATLSGNITFGGNNIVCITGNSKFTGTLTSGVPATTQISIASGSSFTPSGSYYNTGGYFVNYGTLTFPSSMNTVNGTFTIDNYGTVTFNSGVQPNSSITTTFTNRSGATFSLNYYNNSNTTSDVVNINNAGTFTASGAMGFGDNSTFTNSGKATIAGQFNFRGTGCKLSNSGIFKATGDSYFYSNSDFKNYNNAYIEKLTLSGKATFTNSEDGVLTFGAQQISLPDGSSSSITNNGTLNFQIGLQLGSNTTLTNNNDIQMDNSNSTLINNGNFTNYGYVYVNGTYSSNSSSNTYNYCTLVATTSMSIQGNANNDGYMLLPTNGTSSNNGNPLFLVNGGTFTNNGWVQGTNFTNNSAVTGRGNFYFSGYTDVENNFSGTSSGQTMNFYDASRNPIQTGSTGYNYFDKGWGTVTNTVRTTISPVSINIRPSTCSALVLAASQNSECSSKGTGYNTGGNNLLLNGDFATALTTTVVSSSPGTYNSGNASTYSFSGGSFKSQADYNGTTCAKAYSNGNAFAIVAATSSAAYAGASNCSNLSQKYFPGDATYGVAATGNFMAITANYVSGSEFLGYQQTITGLTANNYYTFYFYISNLREPSNTNTTDKPYIRVRVGGTDGLPDGTLYFGPYTFDESTTQNSAALNGWVRVAVTFKATGSTAYVKITDGAYKSSNGDDWGITGMGVKLCAACSPIVASICNTSTTPNSVQLVEQSGLNIASYLWTTTSGGRFYTGPDYSVANDSDVSHIAAPYIKIYGTYSLQITTTDGCTGNGSVTVSSSCGTVLSAAISNFTAVRQGKSVLLQWSTANEVNNDHFDIERSTDGTAFTKIGSVKGNSTTNTGHDYSFTDAATLTGLNYYRLKQVDADGKFHYSEVRLVTFTGSNSMAVYPNPSVDHLVVTMDNSRNEKAQLTITDVNGKVILTKTQALINGSNNFAIYYNSSIAPGMYILKIVTGQATYNHKFIKK